MQHAEFRYHWRWSLKSSPERLWPLVSDTNRFNRDTSLPPVQMGDEVHRANARRRLKFSVAGIKVNWEEEPFEWVRPKRFGVVRRYSSGPTAQMRVLVELNLRDDGGTDLDYQVWAKPRNFIGLVAIPLVMRRSQRRFGAMFRKYDEETGAESQAMKTSVRPKLPAGARERVANIKRSLAERTGRAMVASRLCEAVEQYDDTFLSRLRPYVLADAWKEPRYEVLDLCLEATRLGLLDLQWDILCPLCRGAKASSITLCDLREETHCDTCNVSFRANFERNVELTFKPNPAVRQVEKIDFCVGGPQVTPHVVAQQLIASGASRDLALPLERGRYRIRTLGMAGARALEAVEDGESRAVVAATTEGWPSDELRVSLAPTLQIVNQTADEQVFILERTAWSDLAVTAAEVTVRQSFRDLFSTEVLRPGQQISVGSLTILFTDLRESTRLYRTIGDAPAFGRVLDHFEVLRRAVVAEEGAVIKTIGDAILAVFPRPISAIRAIIKAQEALAAPKDGSPPLFLKAGIHHGPCIAVTLNERLDYFGSTMNIAARLERYSSGEDLITSEAVRHDPEVEQWLLESVTGVEAVPFEAEIKGFDDRRFPLWRIRRLRPNHFKQSV
jgi:class 3 adenylate cyclase